MVDRLFEFIHLFWRNPTVVLRWNVRVDRTSGPDCHLPLPFPYCPCLRVHEVPQGVRVCSLNCRACFMPTLAAPACLLCLWNETDSVMQITAVRRRRADFSSLIHLEVGSWFDCGLLAQTFMLAAKARGLNTCPQISLTKYHTVIRRHLPIDDSQIIACGMSIGCADTGSIAYTINIPRIPVNEFACIVGLE